MGRRRVYICKQCKQVLSRFYRGKVHILYLQGKRGSPNFEFNFNTVCIIFSVNTSTDIINSK